MRFACRVVGVSTAAYYNAGKRHQEPGVDKCAAVRSWLVTFTGEPRRWGYRCAWVKDQTAYCTGGRDVVHHLWRQEGVRVFARKACKQRCLPVSTTRTQPAACPGNVRALDFRFDNDYQGKAF